MYHFNCRAPSLDTNALLITQQGFIPLKIPSRRIDQLKLNWKLPERETPSLLIPSSVGDSLDAISGIKQRDILLHHQQFENSSIIFRSSNSKARYAFRSHSQESTDHKASEQFTTAIPSLRNLMGRQDFSFTDKDASLYCQQFSNNLKSCKRYIWPHHIETMAFMLENEMIVPKITLVMATSSPFDVFSGILDKSMKSFDGNQVTNLQKLHNNNEL